ncbi:MAG: lysophospholipid acyltransferase family protein [Desulfarculus sp.]|nr:lysophospholipid acyltransferase family protein [Desulfarculus sp.]
MSLAFQTLKGAAWLGSLPPLGLTSAVGRGLGRLASRLDDRHWGIVTDNLRSSFPERDEAWVLDTARACFSHLGQVILEIPRLVRLSPESILERTRHHGLDNLEQARALGKGVLTLTGHLGNWEWASVASGIIVGGACPVARPLDWPPADALVNYWRTRCGGEVIPKARSARQVLRALKRNKLVGVLLDQNVDWYDGEWVDFFGRPACTNKGLALLAMATGAPVLTYHNFRAPDGCFDVYFGPPLPLIKSGDKTMDVWNNTQLYTKALEAIIRQRPEQWFWMHQRWKTKPFHAWPREQGR